MKKTCMYFLKLFAAAFQCAAILSWIAVPSVPSPEDISGRPGIVRPGDKGGEYEPGISPQDDWGSEVVKLEG